MQHNEFQRRLEDAHLSDQAMYLLSYLFESHKATMASVDRATTVMLAMANTIEGFVGLNEQTMLELRRLQRGNQDAVVESVRNDPEDYKQ